MPSTKRSKSSRSSSSKRSARNADLTKEIKAAIAAAMPEIVRAVVEELKRRSDPSESRSLGREGAPTADVVFSVAQSGGEEAMLSLLDLPLDALRLLTTELALDPGQRTRRWDRDRLRDFIVDAVMARVRRPHSLLRPRSNAGRAVDWETLYAWPNEEGPRASAYIKLVATPRHRRELRIDGELLPKFRAAVVSIYDLKVVAAGTRSDGIELVWRDPRRTRSKHWLFGGDGSVGYAATLEDPKSEGWLSLWDAAIDCLRFMQLVLNVVGTEPVDVLLEFQPGRLRVTPESLVVQGKDRPRFDDMPSEMRGADPSSGPRIGAVEESFGASEVAAPTEKVASMLVHRWRRIFDLPHLRVRAIADALIGRASSEMSPPTSGTEERARRLLFEALHDPEHEVRIGLPSPPTSASLAAVQRMEKARQESIRSGDRVARVFRRNGRGSRDVVYESVVSSGDARRLLAEGAIWDGPEELRPR